MRHLLCTLYLISDRLTFTLASKFPADGSHKVIDVLPWLSYCALDGVCQGILGYPSNTLSAAESDRMRKIGPLIGKLVKRVLDLVSRCPGTQRSLWQTRGRCDTPCKRWVVPVERRFWPRFRFYNGFKFAEIELEQVLAMLVLRLHFSLPTERNAQGHVKEIRWKLQAFHIFVMKPPAGDGVTPQVPLNVGLAKDDYIW
ncbi:hypothetical protein BDR05DRAFT_1056921 [Suillus weaverae]|nr:hypothetical protein BDR05DRAFT_1056921 [Suillus weaverae]